MVGLLENKTFEREKKLQNQKQCAAI